MMKAKLAKWGNSLALRLPKQYVSELGLSEGSVVELGREGTKVVMKPSRNVPFRAIDWRISSPK